MTLITEAKELGRLAKQTAAVKKYLEQHGSITTHMAIYQGVPGYGPILRLGARIHELRETMKIVTSEENGTTKYTLIREEKETSPSWAGFGRYLRKIGRKPFELTKDQLAVHYQDYCADIRRQSV